MGAIQRNPLASTRSSALNAPARTAGVPALVPAAARDAAPILSKPAIWSETPRGSIRRLSRRRQAKQLVRPFLFDCGACRVAPASQAGKDLSDRLGRESTGLHARSSRSQRTGILAPRRWSRWTRVRGAEHRPRLPHRFWTDPRGSGHAETRLPSRLIQPPIVSTPRTARTMLTR